jgi:hypothetical protein
MLTRAWYTHINRRIFLIEAITLGGHGTDTERFLYDRVIIIVDDWDDSSNCDKDLMIIKLIDSIANYS